MLHIAIRRGLLGQAVAATLKAVATATWSHLPLVAVVALQAATMATLRLVYPVPLDITPSDLLETGLEFLVPLAFVTIFVFCCIQAVRDRPKGSLFLAIVGKVRAYGMDAKRFANGLSVLMLLLLFIPLVVQLKIAIPAIQPFSWDETFARWDRLLFFDRHPYQTLEVLTRSPIAVFLTNIAYNLWFVVMWCVLIACAFMRERNALRTRYLLTFFLVWFLEGGVLALVFSSAGPCFQAALGLRPDIYAPLMQALRDADAVYPVPALTAQNLLWAGYVGTMPPMGISAMPSIHNAVAVLMMLAARHFGRRIGLAFGLYAAWIFVGSIVLAWHYAVDGLVAFVVTAALWRFSGSVARRWHRADGTNGVEDPRSVGRQLREK